MAQTLAFQLSGVLHTTYVFWESPFERAMTDQKAAWSLVSKYLRRSGSCIASFHPQTGHCKSKRLWRIVATKPEL